MHTVCVVDAENAKIKGAFFQYQQTEAGAEANAGILANPGVAQNASECFVSEAF